MELCGSRRKLGLFVVYIAYLSGYFNTVSAGDVCACQPYGCNTCPSSSPCTRENVAIGKPASTSSLFNNSQWGETSGPACLAVNGNTGTVFKPINTNPSDPACVQTADGDYTPYWEVDLKKEYVISSITVYGRSPPDKNNMKSAKVTIDGNRCYSYETDYAQPVIMNITCSSSLTGRRVKIYSNQEFLTVCQVQVWVCSKGYYGSDCLSTCGNCSNGTCDPSSGVCAQGCIAGYQLPYCKEKCISGYYGISCNETCGHCKNNDPCHATTGGCLGGVCEENWQGSKCSEAVTDCQNECSSTTGSIAGAVCGSIACGVVGFLLGILFMRCRLQPRDAHASVARFPQTSETDCNPSPPEESRPPPGVSADYELISQPDNVYDSLKASRDDNVYTKLASKSKLVR